MKGPKMSEKMTRPVEVDTKLAEMWGEYWKVADRAEAYAATISECRKMERAGGSWNRDGRYTARREAAEAKVEAIMVEARPLAEAARDFDKANYEGWNRFFTVPDGHIHRSTSCHSLRITTRIGWTPSLSGRTEAEAVADLGPTMCTICFPSAPVEWTNGLDAKAQAKKDAECPGSRTTDWVKAAKDAGQTPKYGRRYQTCPHCSKSVSVTSYGNLRAHKKEA